jgi:hypothetical protein
MTVARAAPLLQLLSPAWYRCSLQLTICSVRADARVLCCVCELRATMKVTGGCGDVASHAGQLSATRGNHATLLKRSGAAIQDTCCDIAIE